MSRPADPRVLSLLILVGAGCGGGGGPPTAVDSGRWTTAAERSAAFAGLLKESPPGRVVDARYFEEARGGGFGPTDYVFYARITVDPADLPAWLSKSKPIGRPRQGPGEGPWDRKAPWPIPASVDWWMKKGDAEGATFHDPAPLFGRPNGFLMPTGDGTTIYVWAYAI